MKIDKKIIKELNDYLEEFNLTEIEITEKDTKIKVSKNTGSNINQPSMVSYNSPTEICVLVASTLSKSAASKSIKLERC